MMNKVFFYLFSLLFLVACNGELLEELESENSLGTFCPHTRLADGSCPAGASGNVREWSFSNSANYTFDSNFVEVSGGKASLKTVDTSYNGNEFNNGTYVGTNLDSSKVILQTKPSLTSTHVNTILPGKASNLVGYWRMDSDWSDSSQNTNTGTPNGGNALITTDARVGLGAGDFDGVSFTSIGNVSDFPIGNSPRTIAFWFNTDNFHTASGRTPVNLTTTTASGGGEQLALSVEDNALSIGFINHRTISPKGELSVDQWYHVVLIVPSGATTTSDIKLFIDGDEKTLSTEVGSPVALNTAAVSLNIGSASYSGSVDELSLWDIDLSASEVMSLYEAQNASFTELSSSWTPHYNKLVGYWKMDGNWRDSSGNENHGTAVGDSTFTSDGKVGNQAGLFDGVGDSITVAHSAELDPSIISTSMWVRVDVGEDGNMINKGFNSGYRFRLRSDGKSEFLDQGGTNRLMSNSTVNAEEWTHLAAVVDTAGIKLFINGKLDISGGIPYSSPSTVSNLQLGTANTEHFGGEIDDIAIWNASLSESDIATIYNRQKQKYAGHYDSQVIDLGRSVPWTNLNAITTLPFNKELSAINPESSTHYSSLSGNLNNGLIGYWPFNEAVSGSISGADFEDKSSINNPATQSGGVTFGEEGILSLSASLDGTDDLISIPHDSSYDFGTSTLFTISGWVKTKTTSTSTFLASSGGGAASFRSFIHHTNRSAPRAFISNGSQWCTIDGSIPINDGDWHHITFVFNRGSTCTTAVINIYVDGVLDTGTSLQAAQNVANTNITNGNDLLLGSNGSGADYANARFDDVALWNRTLTTSEVQQLYRRGANRIKYQVKSCIDAACNCKSLSVAPAGSSTDCDGDGTLNADDPSDVHLAEWLGHSGADGSTFSELQNCSTVDGSGDCSGDVNDTAPAFTFSDFPAAAQAGNNRYFQYRVLFEAEENTACSGGACLPELTSVEVGPTGRFYGGAPTITSLNPEAFSSITSMNFTEGGSCSHSYQLSRDGTNYYYHNGTSWTLASGANLSESSNSSTTSANISTFASEVGVGSLYFKAFLNSDTSQSCEVDNISLEAAL